MTEVSPAYSAGTLHVTVAWFGFELEHVVDTVTSSVINATW